MSKVVSISTTWRKVKLGDLVVPKGAVSGPFGSDIKSTFFRESGVPVIRGNNLALGLQGERYHDADYIFLDEKKADELGKAEARARDIVITARGTIGQVGIIPETSKYPRYIISANQLRFRINQELADPLFIFYQLASKRITRQIQNNSSNVGVPNFNLGNARKIELDIPEDITNQKRVASILSSFDSKIENNNRIIKILEEMAQAIFKEWFVRFRFPGYEKANFIESELGKIPKGWKIQKYTDSIDVLSGGTPSTSEPSYWNGKIPFFTPADAPVGFYCLTTEKSITDDGLKHCNSSLYPENTIFVTARGTVGKVVLSGMPMAMNQSCYALRGKHLNFEYVFLLTRFLVSRIKKTATGGVFDAIIVATFDQFEVAAPSKEIIDQFKMIVGPMFEQIRASTEENTYLARMRGLLLPKLMSGKVTV